MRVALLGEILARARARGEIGANLATDVAYSFVSGPLHHRLTVLGKPATPAFRRAVATGALAALRAIGPA